MIRKTLIALPLAIAAIASAFALGTTIATAEETKDKAPVQTGPTQAQMEARQVLGNKDAKVTIEAFESLACPHCATFHNQILPALKKKYVDTGKVKFVFYEYPGSRQALYPTMMARCAGPDAYHGVMAVLYKNQSRWIGARTAKDFFNGIKVYGRLVGMSDKQFDDCMKNRALFEALRKSWLEGAKKYNISSTPSFIINGKTRVIGAQPVKDFEAAIDPLIK